jgi:outer membrane protein
MPTLTQISLLCALPALLSAQTISLQDAVRSALANHPRIQIVGAQAEINRGIAQVAAGQFDTRVGASASQSAGQTPISFFNSDGSQPGAALSNYGVNWSKQFRSGISIGQQASALRQNGTQPQVAFTLSVPLMRGRGRAAVDAQEIAAGVNYDASLLDLSHAGAEAVLAVSVAYWNTLAAVRTVEALSASEARARKLVEDTRLMIEADRVPRIDLEQLQANLADKTAARIAAEQTLIEQRQQLGLAMGLATADIDAVPLPADALPEPIGAGILPSSVQDYIQQALERRADLLAARKRQEAAQALVAGAKNGLRPQLTLSLSAGYGGVASTPVSLLPVSNGSPVPLGRNAAANLVYDFSPRNQTALGLLTQTQARVRQELLRTEEISRTVVSGVVTAGAALSRSAAELVKAREATRHHELAVAGENEKVQHGLASLIDLVIADDRLTASMVSQMAAHARYAIAVPQLRFATGTFFDAGSPRKSISAADLITPPSERP